MTERAWTVADALAWTADYLGRKGVDEPRRSAEWLLSAATGLSRVELYAHHDRPLTEAERTAYRAGIERRAAGEPLQHVTGEVAFRHLVLRVRPGVFIPRPETEILVDAVLGGLECEAGGPVGASPNVVDLCAGSGAVGISVAYECEGARVFATELDPVTADLARENAERCGVSGRVTVLAGDLFSPLPPELAGRVDAVAANPPYVPMGDLASLPAEVAQFEPRAALDGGPDGLDVVRRIVEGARRWLRAGGLLAVEVDESRAPDAAEALRAWYEGIETLPDLAGRDRIVAGRLRAEGD